MKQVLLLIFFALLLTSCGSSKKMFNKQDSIRSKNLSAEGLKMQKVSENAVAFVGTRYKYGGTTKRGMDCSGLIYTAFLKEDIPLPRTSRDMSLHGKRLYLKEVEIGDLLFFETDKKKKVINHVGLVVEKNSDELLFIHSTSSRGVIISSFNETYWRNNFVMARRME